MSNREAQSMRGPNSLCHLFRLSGHDGTADLLQTRIIQPNVTRIVQFFYDFIMEFPETKKFVHNKQVLWRLKGKMVDYLGQLGVGFSTQEYVDKRMAVGRVHREIRLPPIIYLAAYANIEKLLIEEIETARVTDAQRVALLSFVRAIIAYDSALAIQTYHEISLDRMGDLLNRGKKKIAELQRDVDIDALTRVASRRKLDRFLELESELLPDRASIGVLMVDIDHFKQVNDQYGHQVGDLVLGRVVECIQKVLRAPDLLSRYGGEEFAVILRDSSMETTIQIAERLRRIVEAESGRGEPDFLPKVTVSVGGTQLEAGETATEALHRADLAMYKAKDAGRNCTKMQFVKRDQAANPRRGSSR